MKELQLKTMDERDGGTLAAMKWFLPRKRTLLSTFGVGTVDQTFLSVLQTRHFFVRLLGLGHKTIIFDEVHAYDTYMSTLFQRLLSWLRAIGASVVILSATLPTRARRDLLQAYAGVPDEDLPDVSYPSITWATEGKVDVEPLEASESRTVALRWIERDAASIVEKLENALRKGGCAAVICNTVRRTQEVYRALRATDLVPEDNLILFHARFPSAWRDETEQDVLSRFGKDGERPEKAIVVATQVIEQSLDLDFDLMVSDLAPVDLLIQRAGRLHRHPRDNRPDPLATPRLLITRPDVQEDTFDFGPDTCIYARYVLLRSYLALKELEQMKLPQDTEALIEAVYGEETSIGEELPATVVDDLAEARREMEKDEDEEVDEAQKRLIPKPQNGRLIKQRNPMLEEESPELHKALRALTRLGPPSIPLVCLHRTEAGLTLEPDGSGPVVDLTEEPDPNLTEKIAQYTLNVSHGAVVQQFLEHAVPEGWREHPLLNDHRAVIFTQGLCPLQGTPYALRLSTEFGLEIEKEMS
jgi:CRISPR-associated endonuclease/helicase Cas3